MLDVLTRTYSISFNDKVNNCKNVDELRDLCKELSVIQNSIIWNEDQNILNSLETFKLFDKMRNKFLSRLNRLNISNDEFEELFLSPSQLLEKFKTEELAIQSLRNLEPVSAQKK